MKPVVPAKNMAPAMGMRSTMSSSMMPKISKAN